jgi:MYXO-CTERM domain-containing protein
MPVPAKLLYVCPLLVALAPNGVFAANPDNVAPKTESQEAGYGYHPWLVVPKGPVDIDLSAVEVAAPVEQPDFESLDEHMVPDAGSGDDVPLVGQDADAQPRGTLPKGWVQLGTVVVPEEVALGRESVDTGPIYAVENIPGNKYPRKHTLFLNFSGGMLYYGSDNSAENHSMLAKTAVYPAYQGGESNALSIIQAVQAKMGSYGIRVLYESRPSKTVPYTMEMVGGSWSDTNIDSAAGGVAPGTDCGALGQRHVVYTFASGGAGANGVANTIAHEAGHAWGLDHSLNCNSVMSYCASGVATYVDQCSGLCTTQCQGNPAGCRPIHDMFCGEGNDQQNDHAELAWIFGGNEPDLEPPIVEIVEPAGDIEVEVGTSVPIRAIVEDDYGGFGWKIMVRRDGVLVLDEVDYGKNAVDDDYLIAYRLSNPEEGTYEVTIEAEDHADHVSRDTVTIVVGPSAGGSAEGGETTGGGGESEDGGGLSEEGGGTEGETAGVDSGDASGDEDKGCGCSASRERRGAGAFAPLLALLGLGGAAAGRRRASARSAGVAR